MQFEYGMLEALSAVVREGTFESAARALNITQSAVSQRIKQLEERTGAVLIVRGRPCVATEYGRRLCRHVDEVQFLEHDLRNSLQSIDNPKAGKPAMVRIAVNSDSLATWFPEVILRAGHELNLHFDIIPDDQEHTAERLRSGEALAAVTTTDKPLQGCKRMSLGAMEYLAVATPRFVERNFRKGVTLDNVAQATHLVYDRKDMLPQQWLLAAFGEGVPMMGHWLPSFSGYLACCLNGAGWGMMPRATVAQHLENGTLVELVPDTAVLISLHWQASARGSEIMRLLSNTVVDVARHNLLSDTYRS